MAIQGQQAASEQQATTNETQLLDNGELGVLDAHLEAVIIIRDSMRVVDVVGMGGQGSIYDVGVVGLEGATMKKKRLGKKNEGEEEPASRCGETQQG